MSNDVQSKAEISNLDSLLRKTQALQKASIDRLQEAFDELSRGETDMLDEEEGYHVMQLVLQYRLDKEDVIKKILHVNQQHCAALGIDIHQSTKKNLDTAAHLLGSDNLLHELGYLSKLCHKLNKLLASLDKTKRAMREEKAQWERLIERLHDKQHSLDLTDISAKKSKSRESRYQHLIRILYDAIYFQESFKENVEQLAESFHAYEGLPKFGLIHDYLAGIKGPISQFHLLEQSGIGLSDNLMHVAAKKFNLKPEKLNEKQLLHKLNEVINKNINLQIEHNRDLQAQQKFLKHLELNMDKQNQLRNQHKKKEDSKRFEQSSRLRRTLNLFSNK